MFLKDPVFEDHRRTVTIVGRGPSSTVRSGARLPIRVLAITLLATAAAWAFQDGFTRLNLTRDAFEKSITMHLKDGSEYESNLLRSPSVSGAVRNALVAMNDQARASVMKELGLAAKSFVMSPAFSTAWDAYLKTSRDAVNHGIQAKDTRAEFDKAMQSGNMSAAAAASGDVVRDLNRQTMIDRLNTLKTLDKQMMTLFVDIDDSTIDDVEPANATEKANKAKARALLAETKKQLNGDVNRARESYRQALMAFLGVQNEAQLSAALVDKNAQQLNYNRLALKPLLKRGLLQFVSVAKTVDFSAATQAKGSRKVFVNPAYEKREDLWKLLYRLGPGGTGAAVSVAQAWAAEL
jgi:hypothetical protein